MRNRVAGWWLGLAQRVYGRDRLDNEPCLCCRTPGEVGVDWRARLAGWMLGLHRF